MMILHGGKVGSGFGVRRPFFQPAFSPTESQHPDRLEILFAPTRLWFGSNGGSNLPRGMGWIFTMGAAARTLPGYAADLASVLGHADRVRPFEDHCVGLMSTEGRKSVEPLAATSAPERTAISRCYTLWLRRLGPIGHH
jgi:hypothetical protein